MSRPVRALYFARYHTAGQQRKVALIAATPGLELHYRYPPTWHDTLYHTTLPPPALPPGRARPLPMTSTDWHRALYRSLLSDIAPLQPDVIYAGEEPDSLTALQLAIARHWYAPHARLLLYTRQNVARRMRLHVRVVRRLTLYASDGMLCGNAQAAAMLRAGGYHKPRYRVQALGVDTTRYAPHAVPPPATPLTIGYVGRLVPEKGVDLLVQAFALARRHTPALHTARLLLVGDGTQHTTLHALAHALGIGDAVTWAGAHPPDAVPPLMQQMHMLVLPSRTTPVWAEQFGRVLVEAMACAVPVIAAATGAIPEVVGDAGLLFPENDTTTLAAHLARLANDATLRQTLGTHGRARALQHYTIERTAAKTAAVLLLVGGAQQTPPATTG